MAPTDQHQAMHALPNAPRPAARSSSDPFVVPGRAGHCPTRPALNHLRIPDEEYIIDTHHHPVCDAVFDLYRYTVQRHGCIPTMIERDYNIPALDELLDELAVVRTGAAEALDVRCRKAA